jgi:hypothetical protein
VPILHLPSAANTWYQLQSLMRTGPWKSFFLSVADYWRNRPLKLINNVLHVSTGLWGARAVTLFFSLIAIITVVGYALNWPMPANATLLLAHASGMVLFMWIVQHIAPALSGKLGECQFVFLACFIII